MSYGLVGYNHIASLLVPQFWVVRVAVTCLHVPRKRSCSTALAVRTAKWLWGRVTRGAGNVVSDHSWAHVVFIVLNTFHFALPRNSSILWVVL